jgi:hypothetical protein
LAQGGIVADFRAVVGWRANDLEKDEASMPWNAGQMRSINDTTPSPAATGSDFFTGLISAAAS